MGKVIDYLGRWQALNDSKVQLSRKYYKQWQKLSEWRDIEIELINMYNQAEG